MPILTIRVGENSARAPVVYVNDAIYDDGVNASGTNLGWNGFIENLKSALLDEDGNFLFCEPCGNINSTRTPLLRRIFKKTRIPATGGSYTDVGGLRLYNSVQNGGNEYAIIYARNNNPSWVSNLTPFSCKFERSDTGNTSGGFAIFIPLAHSSTLLSDNTITITNSKPIKYLFLSARENVDFTYNFYTFIYTNDSATSWYLNAGGGSPLNYFIISSSDDPYNPGGEAEGEIGGEGDFDNTSDPIPEASLPTLSAVDAKFISLYTPTLTELQSLASYMWSPLFDLDTLKKIFADPMKAILGLSILPIAVPSSGQQTVTIGNISTGVNMTKASSQYVQIDCGTLNVNEYWGAYLDYSPYTKLEIYLPYIGTKQISVDDVMNKACHVYYNIDILTGACCAMIKCDDSVLYSYAGQCAVSIPITGSDWTNVVSGALSTALSVVGVAAGAVTGSAPLTGASAIGLVSSASQNVMQMKPIIEKSGSLGGSAGMLGVQSPYLILTRPRQALPNKQNHFTGYPSFVNVKLGDLTGMTFVEQVHLENIPCTSSEQSEIETLLKGGVIF